MDYVIKRLEPYNLTRIQKEYFMLMLHDLDTMAIAKEMNVSLSSYKSIASRIFKAFEVFGRNYLLLKFWGPEVFIYSKIASYEKKLSQTALRITHNRMRGMMRDQAWSAEGCAKKGILLYTPCGNKSFSQFVRWHSQQTLNYVAMHGDLEDNVFYPITPFKKHLLDFKPPEITVTKTKPVSLPVGAQCFQA